MNLEVLIDFLSHFLILEIEWYLNNLIGGPFTDEAQGQVDICQNSINTEFRSLEDIYLSPHASLQVCRLRVTKLHLGLRYLDYDPLNQDINFSHSLLKILPVSLKFGGLLLYSVCLGLHLLVLFRVRRIQPSVFEKEVSNPSNQFF